MKKNKKALIAISFVVIIAFLGVLIYATSDKGDNKPETTAEAMSEASSLSDDETTLESPTEPSSEETTESTTAKVFDIKAIAGQYFYIYDNENIECYVLNFDEKDNVDIAYFNEDNIYNGDPEYFKGYASYSVVDDKIVISNLPESLERDNIEIDIKDSKLYFGEDELEGEKELSIDKVNAHFV